MTHFYFSPSFFEEMVVIRNREYVHKSIRYHHHFLLHNLYLQQPRSKKSYPGNWGGLNLFWAIVHSYSGKNVLIIFLKSCNFWFAFLFTYFEAAGIAPPIGIYHRISWCCPGPYSIIVQIFSTKPIICVFTFWVCHFRHL